MNALSPLDHAPDAATTCEFPRGLRRCWYPGWVAPPPREAFGRRGLVSGGPAAGAADTSRAHARAREIERYEGTPTPADEFGGSGPAYGAQPLANSSAV